MKTEWDYSELAESYQSRPDYSEYAVNALLSVAKTKQGDLVCDIGAGVGHLTLMLKKHNLVVTAVEPNEAMRSIGIQRTANCNGVRWFDGTGESSGQNSESFDLVTFGSSFNVCNRGQALVESARILKGGGWFACMWNHRNLADEIQSRIEQIIMKYLPSFNYGSRREDQSTIIKSSGLFKNPIHIDSEIVHEQAISEVVNAWRSHATLQRQAGKQFLNIIRDIEESLSHLNSDTISIPYTTNIWLAQLKSTR